MSCRRFGLAHFVEKRSLVVCRSVVWLFDVLKRRSVFPISIQPRLSAICQAIHSLICSRYQEQVRIIGLLLLAFRCRRTILLTLRNLRTSTTCGGDRSAKGIHLACPCGRDRRLLFSLSQTSLQSRVQAFQASPPGSEGRIVRVLSIA
jgi:hypothetical protein